MYYTSKFPLPSIQYWIQNIQGGLKTHLTNLEFHLVSEKPSLKVLNRLRSRVLPLQSWTVIGPAERVTGSERVNNMQFISWTRYFIKVELSIILSNCVHIFHFILIITSKENY